MRFIEVYSTPYLAPYNPGVDTQVLDCSLPQADPSTHAADFGMACQNTHDTHGLSTRWGASWCWQIGCFGLVVVALSLLSSVLILMAMI